MATNNATNQPRLTSNGQLIIGGTTATNGAAATLTAGAGISVTNGDSTIILASTGVGSLTWNDVSGTTQTAVVNSGYIISNAGQTTVTLPTTCSVGSVFAIAGKGAAGWILQMEAGQTAHIGSVATSVAGTLTSTNLYDSITIVCVTADVTFVAIGGWGNLTAA